MTQDQYIKKLVQLLAAFELLADGLQWLESLPFFKECKGNSWEVGQVRKLSERMR